jgi:hypothetical protein
VSAFNQSLVTQITACLPTVSNLSTTTLNNKKACTEGGFFLSGFMSLVEFIFLYQNQYFLYMHKYFFILF